jgi:hypothetical protein
MLIVDLDFTNSSERLAARSDHRDLLSRLYKDGQVVAAGPMADDSGALLLFDVTRPELDQVLAADPYYRTRGVKIARIREWTPIVGFGG